MSIKKPLIYSGIAAGALILSSGGVYCARVEQTNSDIRDSLITMKATRKEVETSVSSSPDPAAKTLELEACDKKYMDCNRTYDAKLGGRGTATYSAFGQCESIINRDIHDACLQLVMRGLIASALSTASEFPKCIKGVTECYDKVKKE